MRPEDVSDTSSQCPWSPPPDALVLNENEVLERIRFDVPWERMAKRFFAEAELKAFLALPANQRQEGFFNCWTRKEAYLKAIGTGLSFPLKNVAVSLAPCEPAAILARDG